MAGGLADLFDVRRAHAPARWWRGRRGGLTSPRVELKGTMPAGTSSRVGSSAMSDAEGTTVLTALLEEAQPAATNLGRLHRWSSFRLYEYVALTSTTDFGLLRFSMAL